MVRFCCICKEEQGMNADVSFHSIPKKEGVKAKWLINIGKEVSKSSSVCSKHFKEKDFNYKIVGGNVKRFLVAKAIPSSLLTQYNLENELKAYDNDNNQQRNELKDFENGVCDSNNDQQPVLLINSSSSNSLHSRQILGSITNIDKTKSSKSCVENHENDYSRNSVYTEKDGSIQPSSTYNFEFSSTDEMSTIPPEHEFLFVESDNDKCVTSLGSECIEDTGKQKVTLTRKSEESYKNTKRLCNPRYIGDLTREDFTSDIGWKIVHTHVQISRKKQKALNDK